MPMIGVFDSGVGGICAYRELRRLLPRADIIYLADEGNAPYGVRSPEEILRLTERNIEMLLHRGAEQVLIACCTASTMHEYLPRTFRELSLPIIAPAAELTKESRRVLVIATEHTAKSGAFKRKITEYSSAEVKEVGMQGLVSLIQWGCDTKDKCEEVKNLCCDYDADTLILGCTHFSHLINEFRHLMPHINIISPAHVGARKLKEKIKNDREHGRSLYIRTRG